MPHKYSDKIFKILIKGYTSHLLIRIFSYCIHYNGSRMNKFDWFNRFVLPECFRNSNLGRDGYTVEGFEPENSDIGEGFSSDTISGRILYRDKRGKKCRSKLLFAKTMQDPKRRSRYVENVFCNEIFAYTRVLPFLAIFNSSAVYQLFSEFHFASLALRGGESATEEGYIVVENLSESGYYPTKAKVVLDTDHLYLIVRKLATFHGYSYRAKEKSSQEFYALVDCLHETHPTCTREAADFMKILNEYYFELLVSKEKRYACEVECLRQILSNPERFVESVFTAREEPMAVLCHGDFLRNNVLVKYNDDGKPRDVKFIDVANLRYCSPVVDLANLLYMNTDQETRNEHWDGLIDAYYESLVDTLGDCVWIPTKQQVVREFRRNSLAVYLLTLFFVPFMLELERNSRAEWYEELWIPEYAEYAGRGLRDTPGYVTAGVMIKLLQKSDHTEKVLEILKDILSRDYV